MVERKTTETFGRIASRINDALTDAYNYFLAYPLSFASLVFLTGFVPVCQMENAELTAQTAHLNEVIRTGDYTSFVKDAQKHPLYRLSRNELIYNLDMGLAQVFCGDYSPGAKKLTRVCEQSEDYYTKSISRQVLSVLTNDFALPYYGEDFEVTFAGNVAALAYIARGDNDDALVEIRRTEHRLTVMSDTYEGSDKYMDDGFTHYLAGMLYEDAGNIEDARVSYRLADRAYGGRFFPMKPSGISRALDRLDSADSDDLREISADDSTSAGNRMIIVCAFTGRGPKKDEVVMRAHFTNDGIDHVIKIALPVIRQRTGSIRSVRARLGNSTVSLDCAADYNIIATNAFDDKKTLMYAKTVARVSARYLILKKTKEKLVKKLKEKHEKAKEEHGDDSSEAVSAWIKLKSTSLGLDMLANELLEHADTRCSMLLPERAYCAALQVPPGEHSMTVEYLDTSGDVIKSDVRTVVIGDENSPIQLFTALF